MSNRVQDFGMDVAISRKLNNRYDPAAEAEALNWISQLTGDRISPGIENAQFALKNGQILGKLINAVYDKTGNLPPLCQQVKRPIAFSNQNTPFKHMANIELFLHLAEAYGVPRTSLFQTVDLYEARNMAQVITTILQLGTECQRNKFSGPVCGPKPTSENKRAFSVEQLRSSEGIIGLQAGTNKFASQSGMSFGGQRHVADIRCDDMCPESNAVIGLQMGTNKFASQKGMKIGASRHIADIKCEEMARNGQAVIGLQMGTNQCASQKGMRMGATRHVSDIKVNSACPEGQSVISLQYGTNQCASQKGLVMGGVRHVADIRCEPTNTNSSSFVSLQMGLSQNQCASQAGMNFGAPRQIMDNKYPTNNAYNQQELVSQQGNGNMY